MYINDSYRSWLYLDPEFEYPPPGFISSVLLLCLVRWLCESECHRLYFYHRVPVSSAMQEETWRTQSSTTKQSSSYYVPCEIYTIKKLILFINVGTKKKPHTRAEEMVFTQTYRRHFHTNFGISLRRPDRKYCFPVFAENWRKSGDIYSSNPGESTEAKWCHDFKNLIHVWFVPLVVCSTFGTACHSG